jgi:hypothetical protein
VSEKQRNLGEEEEEMEDAGGEDTTATMSEKIENEEDNENIDVEDSEAVGAFLLKNQYKTVTEMVHMAEQCQEKL